MIDLSGKTALVTGGSRGIGAAVALHLSKAGARVAITYNTKLQKARETAYKIASQGGECLIIKTNVSEKKEVDKAIKIVLNHFGKIDILVNNAGIWKRGPISSITERQWHETMDINLKSVFLFCKEVAPLMKKQHNGKIINIASTAGQRGEAYYSHYAASKGGLIAFSKSIAAELAGDGINVNCVSPGWVDTDMVSHVLSNPEMQDEINRLIPRGCVGSPDDIAGPVLFLASDLSNHMVGAVLNVNGGSILFG
ncbi:MAG: 3-oxoacyl-ACP reductase family protein [bacterium]